MIKTFTPNDVVRYLYKETTPTENTELENAMICNTELLDQCVQFEVVKDLLDKIHTTPSKITLQAILDYSNTCRPMVL